MTSTPLTAATAHLTRRGGGLGHDPARLLVRNLRLLAARDNLTARDLAGAQLCYHLAVSR